MPARAYRILITNTTRKPLSPADYYANPAGVSYEMRLVASNLCWGEWTDGWAPPEVIAPETQAGFRGESAGTMAGTEGWAKYDVVDVDQGSSEVLGAVLIYFNNPWTNGFTGYGVDTAAPGVDIREPCSDPFAQSRPGASGFARERPQSFSLVRVGSGQGPGGDNAADALGHLATLTISFWFTAGIKQNAETAFELRATAPRDEDNPGVTVPAGVVSIAPFIDAVPGDWAGDWRKDDVAVEIRPATDPGHLNIEVRDPTSSPALDVSAVVEVRRPAMTDRVGADVTAQSSEVAGPSSRIEEELGRRIDVAEWSRRPDIREPGGRAADSGHAGVPLLDGPPSASAAASADATWVLGLPDHASVSLLGVFQEGFRINKQLRLLRLSDTGDVITDVMLDLRPDIR